MRSISEGPAQVKGKRYVFPLLMGRRQGSRARRSDPLVGSLNPVSWSLSGRECTRLHRAADLPASGFASRALPVFAALLRAPQEPVSARKGVGPSCDLLAVERLHGGGFQLRQSDVGNHEPCLALLRLQPSRLWRSEGSPPGGVWHAGGAAGDLADVDRVQGRTPSVDQWPGGLSGRGSQGFRAHRATVGAGNTGCCACGELLSSSKGEALRRAVRCCRMVEGGEP